MMNNNLELMESNYCDPYCRNITLVSVVETSISNIFDVVARQSPNDCDAELILTLQVEGIGLVKVNPFLVSFRIPCLLNQRRPT
jgi:hypothetical protein